RRSPRRASLAHAAHPALCQTSTLSLHDALPISIKRTSLMILLLRVFPVFIAHPGSSRVLIRSNRVRQRIQDSSVSERMGMEEMRSEEHTSELQSRFDLVCRRLLERKKATNL